MTPPVQTAEPPSGSRPSRQDVEPAALDLIRRRGDEILRTARHYAATPEDADDAYQRGLEILLTKAPSTDEEQLLPWLKTVVSTRRSRSDASATARSPSRTRRST